ncbi:hypothetical protein [Lentzea sp. E54]|uniref:hypothetical protein n=1 Tax=Lentzea xerophila TaxID=3435883 RepID=UPI003DA6C836
MTDTKTDTVTERVARGVALLDEKQPRWHDRIELSRLDMESGDACILGQLYWNPTLDLGYSLGLDALDIWGRSSAHGFNDDDAEFGDLYAEWVAALRSGEYQQGAGALRYASPTGDRFCCLGVACELFAERLGVEVSGPAEWSRSYDGRDSFLPPAVIAHLRIGNSDPYLRLPSRRSKLASTLNDEGKTFAEIADLIEATYLSSSSETTATEAPSSESADLGEDESGE